MKKCLRCGKPLLFAGKVKLADAEICTFCFKQLGFSLSDVYLADSYHYDEIKDGKDAYQNNRIIEQKKQQIRDAALSSVSVKIVGAGEERDLICTEEERQIYDHICEIFNYNDISQEELKLVRVSDNYVTIKYGDWDLVRCKYTNRAQWLLFPTIERSDNKHEIGAPEDVFNYNDEILESINHIKEYS